MNDVQQRLVMELEREVKKRFPNVKVEGIWERDGNMVALCVVAPDGDAADEVIEQMAPWSVDTLAKTGHLVYVLATMPREEA